MSLQQESPFDDSYECDPDWNYIVRVRDGDRVKLFFVDDNALWRCSKIDTDEWEYLPDYDCYATRVLSVDPAGMQVVLDIIHGNFSKVPKAPSVDTLFGIAMVAVEYEAEHMLLPWARHWLENLRSDDFDEYDEPTAVKKFRIVWFLGSNKDVPYQIIKLVSHSNGTFRELSGAGRTDDYTLPALTKNMILEMRQDMLQAYLGIFQDQVNNLMNRSECQCAKESCNQKILGSLLQSLCAAKLWLKPQAAENSWQIETQTTAGQTPQEVYRVLSRMKKFQSECMDSWFSSVEQRLNDVRQNMGATLSGKNLEKARRRGTMTGCYEEVPQGEE
ncbi:hypothetical protein F5Y18DRAFT_430917 [Xylariaceae sp. FL1019]|nr:hypothetical protein F5Y18DRAFT_430917 [Xylariaceae sp. FL1019]